jgi:SAM-dependent methyltransferase
MFVEFERDSHMLHRAFVSMRGPDDLARFQRGHGRMLERIVTYEASLDDGEVYRHEGWCAVCNAPRAFIADYQYGWTDAAGRRHRNWRERLNCEGCGFNNRTRGVLQFLLGNLWSGGAGAVYLTEQVTPLFHGLQSRMPGLVGSEFLRDGTPSGACDASGIRHEDVTDLSFPNNAFQIIGSFDVLEHVPDYQRALAEFGRCLEPGGWLLLSAPISLDLKRTLVRAVLRPDDEVAHIEPPEFHGDPMSTDGVLCFYHFGWSLLEDLRKFGFDDARFLLSWSRRFGYLGGLQPIVLARKRSNSLATRPGAASAVALQLAQRDQELAALRASTSWKLTAPMRRGKNLFNRLAGRRSSPDSPSTEAGNR